MVSISSGVQFDYKLCLIEDDVRLANLIKEYMQQNNLHVVLEHRGDEAINLIREEQPDLIILDIMLPGLDGMEICKKVRPFYPGPILMLTAKSDDIDQVLGLELGADDYLIKPVQPRVLLAHVKALLRRVSQINQPIDTPGVNANPDSLTFGKLQINAASHEVIFMGEKMDFTSNEFGLLWLLAKNAGKILSRDEILTSMRGVEYDGMDRSVDVRVSKLRKKLLDDTHNPFRIKTVWGKGYLFIKDAWDE